MGNNSIGNSVSEDKQSENIELLPMGHRSSKSAIVVNPIPHTTAASSYESQSTIIASTVPSAATATSGDSSNVKRIPIPLPGTTINVQIQDSSASSSTHLSDSDSKSLTSLAGGNSLQNPQIIIKIQLAKMEENGNEHQQQQQYLDADDESSVESSSSTEAMAVANSSSGTQFVNLTVNGNFIYTDGTNDPVSLPSCSSQANRTTAGGCTRLIKNKSKSDLSERFETLKIQEDWEKQNSIDAAVPQYCEVMNEAAAAADSSMKTPEPASNELTRSDSSLTDSVGCLSGHRKSKTGRIISSPGSSRRRCRDAFRRILEPASNKSLNKNQKQSKKHSDKTASKATKSDKSLSSSSSISSNTVLPSTSSQAHLRQIAPTAATKPPTKASTSSTTTTTTENANVAAVSMTTTTTMTTPPQPQPSASNNVFPITISAAAAGTINNINTSNTTNQVSARIWTPNQSDLIIPITSPPQFVVVQCPPTSVVTLGRIDYNAIRLSGSTEMGQTTIGSNSNGFINRNMPGELLVKQSHNGPIVHSQVDFVHCLVPDLDKIINSSFYWGKIDRYEAERLLEGKPEGTFLLRDSAQEEYLFSVTFRKFGRSLHARIEQSGHKFGFDCHDPSVFTAPTVTGLLQHYKDPTCVMFFEPMLTIPLHRKTAFSLQELARGVIVANTTYDGINELGLPPRVRAFLKEYYYKQKLRFKPLDEMVYWCT